MLPVSFWLDLLFYAPMDRPVSTAKTQRPTTLKGTLIHEMDRCSGNFSSLRSPFSCFTTVVSSFRHSVAMSMQLVWKGGTQLRKKPIDRDRF